MPGSDAKGSYRLVIARFRGISPSGNAIFVDKPTSKGRGTISIPRSLIHGADDIKAASLRKGEEWTFRLVSWKAEEIGFA